MRYVDLFNRPSEAWIRGHAVLSRRTGKFVLDPLPNAGHAVLSGMLVHPHNLQDFKARITWKSSSENPVGLIVALSMPHEWSSIDEAPVSIHVEPSGRVGVNFWSREATQYATGALIEASGCRVLNFEKLGQTLVFSYGKSTVSFDWPGQDRVEGGYLAIYAANTRLELSRFELETDHQLPPLTHRQRQDDIDSWLRWRSESNHSDLQAIEAAVAEQCTHERWGYPTKLDVTPGLVWVGESVTLSFRFRGSSKPVSSITIEPDYLSDNAGEPWHADLEWRLSDSGEYAADLGVLCDRPGNWRVLWDVNGETLSRMFAVLDKGYAVCTIWVGSNKPDIDEELHKYGLPGDYWVGDWWSPFGRPAEDVLEYIRPYARMRHLYGDRLVPFVNAGYILPGTPSLNLMDVDLNLQEDGIRLVQHLWDVLNMGSLEVLGSYTLGHATANIAKKLGIKAINSLCTWQNWLDGHGNIESGWKMNHLGAPNSPYYVADDDFRKVAAGKSVVASSMGTASSVRNYCIFTMEGAPTLTCPMQRYTENPAQSSNITRFYDAVDGWIHDTYYQDGLVFFTVGLENFGARQDWQRANTLGIDYLVSRAATEKLVFASIADIADYYHNHYPKQPETVLYQPDYYCGYRCQNKPAVLPDRIEVSNDRFHTLHTYGRTLPQFFWDYAHRWNEPEWEFQFMLRDEHGLVVPERLTADNTVPRQVDVDGIEVLTSFQPYAEGVQVILTIKSDRSFECLPVAVWRIPLDPETAACVSGSERARWIKVSDWISGNLHGVIVCENVLQGESQYILSIQGVPREPANADFTLGCGVCGRTIYRRDIPHTYLWRDDGIGSGILRVYVPSDKQVEVSYNDGAVEKPDAEGNLLICFDDSWQRETPLLVGIDGLALSALTYSWIPE